MEPAVSSQLFLQDHDWKTVTSNQSICFVQHCVRARAPVCVCAHADWHLKSPTNHRRIVPVFRIFFLFPAQQTKQALATLEAVPLPLPLIFIRILFRILTLAAHFQTNAREPFMSTSEAGKLCKSSRGCATHHSSVGVADVAVADGFVDEEAVV